MQRCLAIISLNQPAHRIYPVHLVQYCGKIFWPNESLEKPRGEYFGLSKWEVELEVGLQTLAPWIRKTNYMEVKNLWNFCLPSGFILFTVEN